MFCVYYGIRAPECLFHKQHKTSFNLFSPDPAVYLVCDKLGSHREIYTFCSILAAFHLGVCHFFFAMSAFTWANGFY